MNEHEKIHWKYYLSQYNPLNLFDSRHPYGDYILFALLILGLICWQMLLLVLVLRLIYLYYFY